jgi:hypothetical protein
MLGEQYPYYQLLRQIDSCSDDELHSIIESWVAGNLEEGDWLRGLAETRGEKIPQVSKEHLCRLYALSRVSDALIVRGFQNSVALASYPAFMNGLGLDAFTETSFHPFYHEIVHVEPDPASETPLSIWEVNWPGFMCGPLMIARAGVSVIGGGNYIRKEIAEKSTLYWAYRRANRPTADLSVGWGHNSEWRTSFRRDYRLGNDAFHYNVDGIREPQVPDISAAESAELLRHRCFIMSPLADDDLFPYDASIKEG